MSILSGVLNGVKLIDRIRTHPAVESIEDEGCGRMVWGGRIDTNWWCYLNDGYTSSEGTRAIHEPTLRDVWLQLKDIEKAR